MSRINELIDAAIVALEDGRDPLERSFLLEHGVTVTEIFDLADEMAFGLRLSQTVKAEVHQGGVVGLNASLMLAKTIRRSSREGETP